MSRLFNMTSQFKSIVFSLFIIPFLFTIFFSSDTYATRVDVDVSDLSSSFTSAGYGNSFSGSYFIPGSDSLSRSRIAFTLSSDLQSSLGCSDVYSKIVYGDNFSSFVPSSYGNVYRYVSGSFNNGIIYHSTRSTLAVVYSSSSELHQGESYTFQSITLGCSEEEVSGSTPTPTPTSTPTPTPTPTSTSTPTPTPTETPDEINPDDYEWNAVEDAIVKYRFMSFIIIAVAGFLLYHIIIKRIILR